MLYSTLLQSNIKKVEYDTYVYYYKATAIIILHKIHVYQTDIYILLLGTQHKILMGSGTSQFVMSLPLIMLILSNFTKYNIIRYDRENIIKLPILYSDVGKCTQLYI